MAVTFNDVQDALFPDEPNYERARALGPEALPHLQRMIESEDPHLAPKAVYAAGMLRGVEAVVAASTKLSNAVRVAAAAATQHLDPDDANPILQRLLNDEYYGARKMALRYVPKGAPAQVLGLVREVLKERDEVLRRLAQEALDRNR